MPTTGTTVSTLRRTLPDDEALGSNSEIVRDLRRVEASSFPKVCGKVCNSAQSPSALPVNKVRKIG